jgi:competence protein ComEC
MPLFALAFVAGVWLLQQLPQLPDFYWVALLVPFMLVCFLQPGRLLKQINLAVLAFGLGFFWAAGHAYVRLADTLPDAWEGRDLDVIGVVASMPQPQERGERFEFDVEQVLTGNAHVPKHISLASYADNSRNRKEHPTTVLRFHAGERWQLIVRLKQPHGTLNPYGFDFEAWAFERDIMATGYIRKSPDIHKLDEFVVRPVYIVEAAREKIRRHMSTALQGKRYAGILQALAIGDEAGIQQADWQTFLQTGTNHLMSIIYPLKQSTDLSPLI